MKSHHLRAVLILIFAIGISLFFYGLSGLNSTNYSGGFEWYSSDRHLIALGTLLMGIPIGVRVTR